MLRITCTVPDLTVEDVERALTGLPESGDFPIIVKPLRYREKPHLSGWTDFTDRSITLQLPLPFLPFGEVIPYGAKRRPGKGKMRFIWLTEGVTFRTPREVLRFLYLHEWMHWWLVEVQGGKGAAETTCDRFALRNFRRKTVTGADAEAARSRPRSSDRAQRPLR